jgi:hypothetical protein
MLNRSGRNDVLPQNLNSALASASHISTFQPRYGARFLLDENAGGAGDGAGTGAGASGAGAGAGSGAAAAGAAAGSGAAAGTGAAAAGGQSGQGDGSPSPYRPDGLPDHLFGKSDKETIDKLNATVTGFRTKQSEAGVVPEKPDAYTIDASDKLKPYITNFDKDPVFAKAREIAHKAGMTDKTFKSFLGPLLENLVDGGLVAAPIDANAMLRSLAPAALANATDAEKQTAGARRVQDNIAWADGAKANQALPEDIASFLAASAADNPAANKLIEWLRGSNGEQIPAMGGGGNSGMNEAQMTARVNDDRNNPSSPKYDKAFAAETDTLSKKHWG